jgi:hypothetical protein
MRPLWNWGLVFLIVAFTAQAPTSPTAEQVACDRLNTAVYGTNGKHGLAQTYRILQQEVSYLDGLANRVRAREAVEVRRVAQTQARYPGQKIVTTICRLTARC